MAAPVLLVPGYQARASCFAAMADSLAAAGHAPVPFDYDSRDGDWDRIASLIGRQLEALPGTGPVSFVGHSLGCLLIRKALAAEGAWQRRLRPHRCVMLAPPNRGSRLFRGVARVLGALTGDRERLRGVTGDPSESVPPATLPFAIIAGGTGMPIGFNPLLGTDNDGILAVDETRDPAAQDFLLVRATHWGLPGNRHAIAAARRFLESGRLAP